MFLFWIWCLSWELPLPEATWQITYDPSLALVTSQGETVLFQGDRVYRYDASGTLLSSGTLPFEPLAAFLDSENQVLVHDGEGTLGCLNSENGLIWQRRFPLPDIAPFKFQNYFVYCVGSNVWLLDTEKGWIQYSISRDETITAVATYKNELLIADKVGRLLQWDPLSGRRLWFRSSGKSSIKYLTVAEDASIAVITVDGEMEVLSEKRKVLWKRAFHIEMAQAPLWVRQGNGGQWVVATHGRHYSVFSYNGKLIADKLLPNRPMVLLAFDQTRTLLLPFLSPEMMWYLAKEKVFKTELLSSYQNLVVDQDGFLLMVGADGQIRLYKKDSVKGEN